MTGQSVQRYLRLAGQAGLPSSRWLVSSINRGLQLYQCAPGLQWHGAVATVHLSARWLLPCLADLESGAGLQWNGSLVKPRGAPGTANSLAKTLPSGEKHTDFTTPSCPSQRQRWIAGFYFPYLDFTAISACGQVLAVRSTADEDESSTSQVRPSCTLIACSTACISLVDSRPTRFWRRRLLTVVNWSAIALSFSPAT